MGSHLRFADSLPVHLLGALLLGWIATATAAPLSEPVLQLAAGNHTAPVKDLATDARGRLLLSVSYDKTARLRDAGSGEELRTLRVPVGPEREGQLFAAALSPDGRTAYVGGRTSGRNEHESLYLFDTASGELTGRIGDLPNIVLALSASADGSTLAVTLGSGELLLIDLATRRPRATDRQCTTSAYGLAWRPDGQQLATACGDGVIRLYDAAGKLLRAQKPVADAEPSRLAWSPDGRMIALTYNDRPLLRVLKAADLKPLATPNTSGLSGDLGGRLAWSADGRTLYAGGTYNEAGRFPVLAWTQAGRGTRQTVMNFTDTVSGLLTLPDGTLVGVALDATQQAVDGNGKPRWRIAARAANLRGTDRLRVGQDGSRVQFTLANGSAPALFELQRRLLSTGAEAAAVIDADLRPARTRSTRLQVALGDETKPPTLNAQPLVISPREQAFSFALADDDASLVLGTLWRVRRYGADGQQRWAVDAPAAVWAVNLSGDGRLVVAACADGTLRWYRHEDGTALLSLFVDPQSGRWVAWTPQGYYAASPGGEQLIGWQVNRGTDLTPDFHAAAQLRERYFRPDVVARTLEALDTQQGFFLAESALAAPPAKGLPAERPVELPPALLPVGTTPPPGGEPPTLPIKPYDAKSVGLTLRGGPVTPGADQMPPIVTLLSPADGTRFDAERQSVRVRIRSAEPLTGLKLLVDGTQWPESRAISRPGTDATERVLDVQLPTRDLELSVIAENRWGASQPASGRMVWAGDPADAVAPKPRLVLLAIGIGQYDNPSIRRLEYPVKDAEDFVRAFGQYGRPLYREIVQRIVPNARREGVYQALKWLRDSVKPGDTAIVLLAGHGVADSDRSYLFLPSDADPEQLDATAVPDSYITKMTSGLPGHVVMFLDTCRAGTIRSSTRSIPSTDRLAINLSQPETGVVVFAASTGEGFAEESPQWNNGAFTKALIEGLSGQADYHGDGRITVTMLELWLGKRVRELTDGRQVPTTAKPNTIPDFAIAALK